MKKSSSILFLILVVLISCKSKYRIVEQPVLKETNYIPYYLKMYEADSLRLIGNHKQAQHILDSLFKKFEPLNQDSYGEYVFFLSNKVVLNDFKNIDKVLKNAISNYGLKIEYCLNDSLLKIATIKSKFSEQDLIDFYESYTKSLNLDYRYEIEKMIEDDQRVRTVKPVNHDDWVSVDKENAANIKLLIEKYGYPSTEKIGKYDFNKKSSSVSTLFLHAKKEATESYILDLMLEAVKKGECQPHDYATVYDKYLYVHGEFNGKTLYGEFKRSDKSLDETVIYPKKLDSIRKTIGLPNVNYINWKLKKLGYK